MTLRDVIQLSALAFGMTVSVAWSALLGFAMFKAFGLLLLIVAGKLRANGGEESSLSMGVETMRREPAKIFRLSN
jgi:hypothetical protein